ncbi:unnamed protein product [Fraxinus pennsylvanica]|uniref:Uncharacterized protein n=1 Tax=Fraxinus pennsylvanica TaxID=56036 RepID=A0AAD1Z4W1_9LAMI|nr:unnamed protein product [Fraxinus pennsylvanica]
MFRSPRAWVCSNVSVEVGAWVYFAVFVLPFGFLSDRSEGGVLTATEKTSVLKLQVGLLGMGRSLQTDLNRIAETTDTSSSDGLHYVLTGNVKEIGGSSNPSDLIKGYEQLVERKKWFINWENLIKSDNLEKDHWVLNEPLTKRTSCGSDFNAFNRKCHYQNCGDIFSDKCTRGRGGISIISSPSICRTCSVMASSRKETTSHFVTCLVAERRQ